MEPDAGTLRSLRFPAFAFRFSQLQLQQQPSSSQLLYLHVNVTSNIIFTLGEHLI